MDYLMGIDLGSTSLKAVVYDLDGNPVASGARVTEQFHPSAEHPEWTVWRPEQIWEGTGAAIRDAIGELDDAGQIRAVAVTGMGMDGLPVDESGTWLYPMISWHDPRTAPQLDWWAENVGIPKTFSIGGNPVWPINSALRIRWMAENEPEILARADKWLLIEDFLNFMLCGRQVTDYSMASCTMLFDQKTLSWSDELLEASGIDRRLLCDVQPSGTPLGEVTTEAAKMTGLREGTPVILGGHDHLCGALPVGAFRPGVVLNVTGTWEMVMTTTDTPQLGERLRETGMTVQAHVARGAHATWGGNVAAGMLEWYRQQFGYEAEQKAAKDDESVWKYLMDEAAASAPGAGRVMFLPHMSASTCPVVDSKSLGAFIGLSDQSTQGDMLRAMVEGLCFQLLDMAVALEEGLGISLDRFVTVGGAAKNVFWNQTKADIVGRPLDVPDVEESTPLGAAMLAGIGIGLYGDEEDAYRRVNKPGTSYQPDPERAALHRDRFELYRQIYPAISPIHQGLG